MSWRMSLFDIQLKAPKLIQPSASFMCLLMVLGFFLISSGLVYDIIVQPPGMGSQMDPVTGQIRSVAFQPHRINGQYIIEGLSAGFLFTMGGLGIVLLDWANDKSLAARNRYLYTFSGFVCVVVCYNMCVLFMKIKVPGYMQ